MSKLGKAETLENIHYKLMNEYIKIITFVDNLPFFVDISSLPNEDKQIKIHPLFLIITRIILYGPRIFLRLICLRPLVKLFVESHIKSKVEEIRFGYTHLLQTRELGKKIDKETQWLIDTSKSLSEFSNTLVTWRNLSGLVAIIANFSVALYGAKTIYDLFLGIFFETNNIFSPTIVLDFLKNYGASLIYTIVLSLTFLVLPFEAKRCLFIPGILHNTYILENNLFKIIGRTKKLELPIDYLAFIIYTVVFPLAITFLGIWIATDSFSLSIDFKASDILPLIKFTAYYIAPEIAIFLYIRKLWIGRKSR